jgi:hypothetical protein
LTEPDAAPFPEESSNLVRPFVLHGGARAEAAPAVGEPPAEPPVRIRTLPRAEAKRSSGAYARSAKAATAAAAPIVAGATGAGGAYAPARRVRRAAWYPRALIVATAVLAVLAVGLTAHLTLGRERSSVVLDRRPGPAGTPGAQPPPGGADSPSPSAPPASPSTTPPVAEPVVPPPPPPVEQPPPITFTAVTGEGCRQLAAFGYYRRGFGEGWQRRARGGWRQDGCRGDVVAAPVSGSATHDDPDNFVVWWFKPAGIKRGSCTVYVYVPDTGEPHDVAGRPAHYLAYGRVDLTGGVIGEFQVDQPANRGRWVDAGELRFTGGELAIRLATRGVDAAPGRHRSHVGVSALSVQCRPT